MSTNENFTADNLCNLNNNNKINDLPTLSETSTAIETNPTTTTTTKMDSSPSSKNIDKSSCNDESNPSTSLSQEKPATESAMQLPGDNNDSFTTGQQESANEQQNDSLTFSTAFTISFEDDSNTSKKLGIKDSIRKFAPPKPHTIEKPRQPKSDQCQDHSLVSVESAPAGLSSTPSNRKGCSNSSRSSSRKSNSSRHSNISESAAFLIDKMLNCKQAADSTQKLRSPKDKHPQGSSSKSQHAKSPSNSQKGGKKVQTNKRLAHSSDDILDGELDFGEDRSDNGTYIVGADGPESEAARKKIDELFGVVKAAEASVIAESAARNQRDSEKGSGNRQSRLTDKKPLNRERQEHINRLAYRNSSRSSSSSRQDNADTTNHHPRSASRGRQGSRNSSCDRAPRPSGGGGRARRSASQSSRQSSNKELSDGDTRSSRSSLHHDADLASNHESSISNHPSMKFNRAFALRRARLGLGEPVRAGPAASSNNHQYISQENELLSSSSTVNNMSSSQRRHQINSNTYRASQQQHQQVAAGSSSSTGSANFCRDDGGRFSLRMKNNALPSRLSSANAALPAANRPPQHGGGNTLIDNYLNKVSSGAGKTNVLGSLAQQQQQQQQEPSPLHHHYHQRTLAKHTNQSSTPCAISTGGLGSFHSNCDEPEIMSLSRYRLFKAGRLPRKGFSDLESDTDSYAANQRFNYSLNSDYENYASFGESRANSSVGSKQRTGSSNLQLGALDSLVISAISSLSLKIRDSVCDVLIDHAKKLPVENETRLIVEEILPQLAANPSSSKSPTSIEEIDQSLYFDLAKTLKNLKKVEQMVDVINHISGQIPSSPNASSSSSVAPPISSTSSSQQQQQHLQHNNNNSSSFKSSPSSAGHNASGFVRPSDSATNSEMNSLNDLSTV